MRTAKSRIIIRHIFREESQPDPLLVPLLQAADEDEAADWLVILIEQHARPVIERVAGRGREAEAILEGSTPDASRIAHAADEALRAATPLSQNRYKIPMARTAIRRTLASLT